MPKKNSKALTDPGISKIGKAAKGKRAERFDALAPGLCLRVTDSGTKSWSVYYRFPKKNEPERLERLRENTRFFRAEMARHDFRISDGEHPIVPIMIGDEKRTVEMARALFERGLYVVGFTYPVVPRGEARIRVQISAAHTTADLQRAVETFAAVRDENAGPDAGE